MRDDLLHYYERELEFIRRTAVDFARRYPARAGRLLLEPNKCDDPHVERLLEGFAFLAARVHLKLDDDFSEFSQALLDIVYPHYTRPIPSMATVQFQLDPEQGKLTTGLHIPRGSLLYSRPVAGVPCRFRTCYDTTLWPVTLASAKWVSPHELRPAVRGGDAVAALRIELHGLPDVRFAELELDTLRLHISAEPSLSSTLYELLCNSCLGVMVRDLSGGSRSPPVTLPPSAVQPVGFGEEDGMVPYPRRSFLGYRLLQEYFAFPDKFYFLDVSGFDRVRQAGFGERIELVLLISAYERAERRAALETGVTADTIRLACSPIVNLFPLASDPVQLTHTQHEYPVVPDARRRAAISIYSVDEVVAVGPGTAEPLRFEPLYSFRHGRADGARDIFWMARRRPATWHAREGTEVCLSFVDRAAGLVRPDLNAVTAKLTCFNADLPGRLPFGDPQGDFEMRGGGPITRITALIKPTNVVQPPLGKPQLWRLISQLSLNYVALEEGGAEGLRELLHLHNTADTLAGEKQIQSVRDLRSSPCYARVASEHGVTFARGHRVEIDFDEEEFAGGSVYLLASVIERFLGMYASMNSFSVLAARSLQRKQPLREWPPRAGRKAVL